MNRVVFSKGKDDWATPWWLFKSLDAEFRFTIDVCAEPHTAKCKKFFTSKENALVRPWKGRCWCNPPYSELDAWVSKAVRESDKGALVVMLIPARTDRKLFHRFIWDNKRHCFRDGVSVRFLKGRVNFQGGKYTAPFPSMIVVFWPNEN